MHSDRFVKIAIRSQDELQSSYIPFLKKGGIIIPADQSHDIGSYLKLSIELLDYAHPFEVVGKIVWLTPEHTKIDKLRGTGVEFIGGDDVQLCKILRENFHKPEIHHFIKSAAEPSPQFF